MSRSSYEHLGQKSSKLSMKYCILNLSIFDLAVKKFKVNPRSLNKILSELEHLILHIKFQDYNSSGSRGGERFLKGFSAYMGIAAMLVT